MSGSRVPLGSPVWPPASPARAVLDPPALDRLVVRRAYRPRPDPLVGLGSPAAPARPAVLYFDIDGTLVRPTFGAAKPALAAGRFEAAVRRAGFERLVCVSDAVLFGEILASAARIGAAHDVVLQLCRGTIRDAAWFGATTRLVADPLQRARFIDIHEDWYYLDDAAFTYLQAVGSPVLDRGVREGRVCACDPGGDGSDVLAWLSAVAARRAGAAPRRPPALGPASTLA